MTGENKAYYNYDVVKDPPESLTSFMVDRIEEKMPEGAAFCFWCLRIEQEDNDLVYFNCGDEKIVVVAAVCNPKKFPDMECGKILMRHRHIILTTPSNVKGRIQAIRDAMRAGK